MKRFLIACLVAAIPAVTVHAADWPMYRGDAGRTGYTAEQLPAKLRLAWVRKARHKPMPAWPASDRMTFDRAYQPVIAGGMLFFGSSADCKLYALDAETGSLRWSFFTGGPIRFAPAVWKERVFVASDDGHLYCLSSKEGKLLWKKRGGPDDRMILGNDRMISRWPARGGPVIRDNIVYFSAGIWPSDGIYLYALDAESGKVLWNNDKSGSMYMAQPHGGAYANSGVSSQGYLVATTKQLFVPTGRAVPAAFDRATGKFQYFHLQKNRRYGGNDVMATDDVVINSGLAFDAKTGSTASEFRARTLAVSPKTVYISTKSSVGIFKWESRQKRDRKGNLVSSRVLVPIGSVPNVPEGKSLIVSGDSVAVGGEKKITLVNAATKKITWSAETDGTVHGLAVSAGRLYAATDEGTIYCFARDSGASKPVVHLPKTNSSPFGDNAEFAKAAKAILSKTEIDKGYCLDYECGNGELAFELAKRTRLQIYARASDPKEVALARKKLDDAGLYGVRVTVHLKPNYPDYFANLAVSARALQVGLEAVDLDSVYRMQGPYGGRACVGKIGAMKIYERGELKGAGSWTHQYADAANTCCSLDDRVKGPLGMLWFRDSDFAMPQRHGRGPAPLNYKGYLIVEGMHGLRCTDAYNGHTVWEFPLKDILKAYNADHLTGTAITGSNICVSDDGVFIRAGDRCFRLDLNTGKKLNVFNAPKLSDGKAGPWGYIACEDGILFGSVVNSEHELRHAYRRADMSQLFSESKLFFAFDAKSGKQLWTYVPKNSIRHNAIAIGNGKVHLIDRALALQDRRTGNKKQKHPPGTLLALDARSGKALWQENKDIWGTTLMLSTKHDKLLMCYQYTRFRQPSEIGGKLAAFAASNGKRAWETKARYSTRPLINDQTIYAQGGAWDLLTGEGRTFNLKRSYGCGQISASKHLMLFRSATLGYYDMKRDKGSVDYGGMRPGCWINAIPAGGLVLVPDASSGCSCSYLNRAWIALQGMELNK